MSTKPLTDQEIFEAKELCVQLGECTPTLYLCMLLGEVDRLKAQVPAERLLSRLMGLEDGMRACEKVINAARLFCESTAAEMDELSGTESASAPAEFMLLHEAIKEFDADRHESAHPSP